MFEVGFSELLLIMGLALLVLGPEKLPKVVGQIGRWMGRARAMARQFREQLEDETAEISRQRSTPPPTPAASSAADVPNVPGATDIRDTTDTTDTNTPTSSESSIAPPADPNTAPTSNDSRT
jgi:sec-independent protein translocase protein TatB